MKSILMGFLILLCLSNIFAQDEYSNQTIGLTSTLSNQVDISVPIFLGDYISLAPTVGVSMFEENYTDWEIGIVYKNYFNRKRIAPFISIKLGALIMDRKKADGIVDGVFGGGFGGEYFFSNNFSAGIEAQLNFSISNSGSGRFGNPGNINVNTATVIFAAVYF
ncbi:MAG: hypothetical protein C4539_02360 [Ignavibacteriales bacterium]|nr:MAG: hypothetical protein C4539_02360 [Ignavibacteriales bacterium]